MEHNQDSTQEREQLTPEEYMRRKTELTNYWEGEMRFLNAQVEYQKAITELEELRARYIKAQIMIANMTAPPPDEATQGGPEVPVTPATEKKVDPTTIVPKGERKLRTEKAPV